VLSGQIVHTAVLLQHKGLSGLERKDGYFHGRPQVSSVCGPMQGNVETQIMLFLCHLDRHGPAVPARQFRRPRAKTFIGPLEAFGRPGRCRFLTNDGLPDFKPGHFLGDTISEGGIGALFSADNLGPSSNPMAGING